MTVIECLRTGRLNAVSRAKLANRTGHGDRFNRKEIERLRHDGIPIMSTSDGKGYWIAEHIEEIEKFLREVDARTRAQQYPKLRRLVWNVKGVKFTTVREHRRRIGTGEIEGQVIL